MFLWEDSVHENNSMSELEGIHTDAASGSNGEIACAVTWVIWWSVWHPVLVSAVVSHTREVSKDTCGRYWPFYTESCRVVVHCPFTVCSSCWLELASVPQTPATRTARRNKSRKETEVQQDADAAAGCRMLTDAEPSGKASGWQELTALLCKLFTQNPPKLTASVRQQNSFHTSLAGNEKSKFLISMCCQPKHNLHFHNATGISIE